MPRTARADLGHLRLYDDTDAYAHGCNTVSIAMTRLSDRRALWAITAPKDRLAGDLFDAAKNQIFNLAKSRGCSHQARWERWPDLKWGASYGTVALYSVLATEPRAVAVAANADGTISLLVVLTDGGAGEEHGG